MSENMTRFAICVDGWFEYLFGTPNRDFVARNLGKNLI